jgi:hypothetical protein
MRQIRFQGLVAFSACDEDILEDPEELRTKRMVTAYQKNISLSALGSMRSQILLSSEPFGTYHPTPPLPPILSEPRLTSVNFADYSLTYQLYLDRVYNSINLEPREWFNNKLISNSMLGFPESSGHIFIARRGKFISRRQALQTRNRCPVRL